MARKIPNTPSRGIWFVGLIAGSLGILSHFVYVETLSENTTWLLMGGFVLLALGTTFRNI